MVTGDITQTDLPGRPPFSYLSQVVCICARSKASPSTFFDAKDVVRHPLVQRIVQAYESREGGPVEATRRTPASAAVTVELSRRVRAQVALAARADPVGGGGGRCRGGGPARWPWPWSGPRRAGC